MPIDCAFLNCSGLTSITVDSSNTVYYSGNNCIIEKSTKTLILGCKNSIIPDSVTSIGGYAFYGCSGLTSITIPYSVTSISDWAFWDCNGLTSVFYKGTAEQWGEIVIKSYNYNLIDATKYYYSETKPTEAGNYWHYDTDGVTPMIW